MGANATINLPAGLPSPALPGQSTGTADVTRQTNMLDVWLPTVHLTCHLKSAISHVTASDLFEDVSPDALKLLRASVSANSTFNPPAVLPNPSLPGETTGTADVHGMMNMSQVLIVAEPWIYNMTVTLPGFPSVSMMCPSVNTCRSLLCCSA